MQRVQANQADEPKPLTPMTVMRLKDVAKLFKVQPRTVRAWVARGEFPRPIVKPNMSFWTFRTIDKWLRENGQ